MKKSAEMKIEETLVADLLPLLRRAGLIDRRNGEPESEGLAATVIAADGSARRFARIQRNGQPLCLAISPASQGERDMAESRAAWQIGRHLAQKGIQVPALYIRDQESGTLLCEDLGDIRLYAIVKTTDFADSAAFDRLRGFYEQTIEQLLAMQIDAAVDFAEDWCWDTPGYFRLAFCVGDEVIGRSAEGFKRAMAKARAIR